MKIKRLFAVVTSALVLVSGTAGMNICASDSEEEISGSTLENIDVFEKEVIVTIEERFRAAHLKTLMYTRSS